jgi:hypothetical protein
MTKFNYKLSSSSFPPLLSFLSLPLPPSHSNENKNSDDKQKTFPVENEKL